MYAKCGALAKAKVVFEELPFKTVVSWNSLITAYVQHGNGDEALACFHRMQDDGHSPSPTTFTCLVKACGSIGAFEKGEELHAEIVRMGLLASDVVLGSALVDMYSKFGLFLKAREVLNGLKVRNIVSWTSLIIGYCESGYATEALDCCREMKCEGLTPDAVTLTCMLKACCTAKEVEKGRQVHAEILRNGFLRDDTMLGAALVDMYGKCGTLPKAKEVFDELPVRDAIPWSVLIACYSENGHGNEALNYFEHMIHEGHAPDAMTFACVLKACGSIGADAKGKEIHADIVRNGMLGNSTILSNALVDMYAKCGAFAQAKQVFNEHPIQDVVSCTSLIAGYCQHGRFEEAIKCYEQMKGMSLSPNAVTLACILKACASVGATGKGEEVHAEIARQDLLRSNTVIAGALVDMYAKCGALGRAQEVCEEVCVCDVVAWSALMVGYCQYGQAEKVLSCFELLREEGLTPDEIMFSCVLKACSRLGAAGKGQEYFEAMSSNYGMIPTFEHHSCMVDLFCRSGLFERALAVIEKMPSLNYLRAWFVLMSSCKKWGNVKLGKLAFQHATQSMKISQSMKIWQNTCIN
ncbi:hypothetical protein KP509_28G051100 [Ceratopteris richardii]|nr:hypothetical protein KP509_28G051100 [Ceratopteris richardii]